MNKSKLIRKLVILGVILALVAGLVMLVTKGYIPINQPVSIVSAEYDPGRDGAYIRAVFQNNTDSSIDEIRFGIALYNDRGEMIDSNTFVYKDSRFGVSPGSTSSESAYWDNYMFYVDPHAVVRMRVRVLGYRHDSSDDWIKPALPVWRMFSVK